MQRWLNIFQNWTNASLAFFYPEECQLCHQHRAGPSEGYVCEECRQKISWITPPCCRRCGIPFQGAVTVEFECGNCRDTQLYFAWARAAVSAEGPVLEAIHRYKYSKALWIEPFLAGLLVSRAAAELQGEAWTAIVPVPLHPTRQREREFNQAQRLARRLSQATGIPVAGKLLRRVLLTPTQTRLTREQRRLNMRNAFAASEKIPPGRYILLDDVLTTGATTNECARELMRAGASEVCVWTVARGLGT